MHLQQPSALRKSSACRFRRSVSKEPEFAAGDADWHDQVVQPPQGPLGKERGKRVLGLGRFF